MWKAFCCIALACGLAVSAAAQRKTKAKTVTLTGQIICSGCWDEADRQTTPYGTKADLECAERCAKANLPAALAVRDWKTKAFTLYLLEDGKFDKGGKNWLKYMAQRVDISGPARRSKGKNYLKVDALKVLEDIALNAHYKEPPVELELKDLNGETRRLSDLRGRVVVLNFWAHWCGPCRRELPILHELAKAYAGKKVDFITASLDELADQERMRDYVAREKITLPVWVGATKADKARFGLPPAIPSTVVINRQGRIVWRYNSVVKEEEVKAQIDKYLR
jgi:thiol-disulfide isomerase/thioredoxin